MNQRLSAIFLINAETLPFIYGPTERAELEQLTGSVPPLHSLYSLLAGTTDTSRVEAIFSGWGVPPLDETLLRCLPACRIVFHAAGTVRPFATPALWRQGIRLTSAAEANAIPVAEYTLAAVIFSLKHVWQRIAGLRDRREYRRSDSGMPGSYGSTVGLLSLSRTGRKVAERLRALDVRVIAYDPVVDPALALSLGVDLRPLAEVFARADVVSCHMPLLPGTTGALGAGLFALMKPGAAFINTARGDLVRESELISVLRQRPDLTAVLDVQQHEPIPANSPLFDLPNVVLTPHIAGSLGPECRRMGRFMVEEARRYLVGEPLKGEIKAADLEFMA